ncbi:MAG: ParA family protein, partial [Gammaproteobacteria bacterium]|nr:ParA family protein [Gammaproteobacteria bacterium]
HSLSRPLIHFVPEHKLSKEFVALYEELENR